MYRVEDKSIGNRYKMNRHGDENVHSHYLIKEKS